MNNDELKEAKEYIKQLETYNNNLCDINLKLSQERDDLNVYIKRLEDAGDVMYKLLNPPSISMRTIEYDNALQGWDDAKIKS